MKKKINFPTTKRLLGKIKQFQIERRLLTLYYKIKNKKILMRFEYF